MAYYIWINCKHYCSFVVTFSKRRAKRNNKIKGDTNIILKDSTVHSAESIYKPLEYQNKYNVLNGQKQNPSIGSDRNNSTIKIEGNNNTLITDLNISNNLNSYDSANEIDELIQVLNLRAESLEQNLKNEYELTDIQPYLDKFQGLHIRHIEALEKGDFILAHELLSQIHNLSFSLAENEANANEKIIEDQYPFIQYLPKSPIEVANESYLINYYLLGKSANVGIYPISYKIITTYGSYHSENNKPSSENSEALYQMIIRDISKEKSQE